MKSEKGITLISLTIYVIVMVAMIGIIAIVSGVFMKSMKDANFYNDPIAEYTAFNSYFSEQVNHSGLKISACEENYIIFSDGVQYSFIPENKGIYKDKVKICRNIDQCTFSKSEENGKEVVTVHFVSGGQDRTTKYTLK